ncbi:hypothetical protein Esti_006442 [Eimeria stiedai]
MNLWGPSWGATLRWGPLPRAFCTQWPRGPAVGGPLQGRRSGSRAMVLRVGPLQPPRGAPLCPLRLRGTTSWIGLAASACKTAHAAAARSPLACTFVAAPHAATSWPSGKSQAAALLLLPSERLHSRGPPTSMSLPGPPFDPRCAVYQACGLSNNCCLLRSSCNMQGSRRGCLLTQQQTRTTKRETHQTHSSNFSASNNDSRSSSSSSGGGSNNSNTSTSNSKDTTTSSTSSSDDAAALAPREGGGVASSRTSLWQLLFAAVWPASPGLRARVVAAVVSLMAAKCLTIAAPVALAAAVDHFTQTAAAGAAAAATAAAAADESVTGPAALLHPALPVALVLSYPLARLGASGNGDPHAAAAAAAFTELRTALFARVSQRASRDLAAAAFAHMHATAFSSNNKIGELSTILTRGTKAISLLLNVLLFQVVPTSLEFLLVLGLLQLRVGLAVSVTAVATLAVYWMFTAAVTTRRAKLRREMIRVEGQSAGLLVDSLANAEAVRYFTAEGFEARRFEALQEHLEEQMARVNESLAFLNFGQQLIFTSGLAIALLHTATLVAAGAVPVGQLVLVSTLLMQVSTSASQQQQQRRLVLNGFSLEVPAGRRVALVGESGSGKTTLIRLLYRLVDPSSGCVLIDDQDLKALSMDSFRRHIGVVPQDVALFNESLGFNVRYGSPEATDAQVEEAVRLAELSDLVHALPGGLDTPVGDRGVRLSGGEKQRVGIARCILRNPEIVLFDEATSALDTHTEHKILRALSAVSRGRTTLVIAHRLSTVAGADTIAVLSGGRVAELGTHAQLLQSPKGIYASMWERQARRGCLQKGDKQREGQGGEPSPRSP